MNGILVTVGAAALAIGIILAAFAGCYLLVRWIEWTDARPRRYKGDPTVCMCGSYIRDHGMTENHAPVSEVEYLRRSR